MAISKQQLIIELKAQGIKTTKAQLKGLHSTVNKTSTSMGGMAAKLGGATVAFYAASRAISAVIKTGSEFQKTMSNVKAISGATATQFAALEANAKKLGATTVFTASQVGELQTEFAKLGFTATEITKVTAGTLALASAVGSDLATAAATAGTTLRGFGLDVSETNRVTDVMAKSFSSSALDMSKFTESMKFVAPVAKMAGFGLEGTTAILGQLANAGLSGSMAGTALRSIFLKLADTNSALSQKLGGSVNSVEELIPALNKLKDEGVDLTEMLALTDKRAVTAFGVLLDGSEDVNTLAESLRNASGAAQRMADIQLDNLAGKSKLAKSAMDGLAIALFERMAPGLEESVIGFTSFISSMERMIAIPASENLEKQRIEVNNLTHAIEMSEVGSENRNRLMMQLNDIHPDLLQGLSDEEIAQGKLTKRLKSYNEQQSLKIALVQADEETLKLAEKKAELDVKLASSTMAVSDAMRRLSEATKTALDPQKSMAENYRMLLDARQEALDGMTKEQSRSEEGEAQINAMAQSMFDLVRVYNSGAVGIESYVEILNDHTEAGLALADAEEIQRIKMEIINNLYSTTGESIDANIGKIETEANQWLELQTTLEHLSNTSLPELEEAYTSVLDNINMQTGEFYANLEIMSGTSLEGELIRLNTKEATMVEQLRQIDESSMSFDEKEKARNKINDLFDKKRLSAKFKSTGDFVKASGDLAKVLGASEKDVAIGKATIDGIVAVQKAWTSAPFPANLPGVAITLGSTVANVAAIQAQQMAEGGLITGPGHSGGGVNINAEGGEFVMKRDAVDAIGIETMNAINEGGGDTSGGGITVNLSGNILTQDFVEGELAEAISEAVRRGNEFGMA